MNRREIGPLVARAGERCGHPRHFREIKVCGGERPLAEFTTRIVYVRNGAPVVAISHWCGACVSSYYHAREARARMKVIDLMIELQKSLARGAGAGEIDDRSTLIDRNAQLNPELDEAHPAWAAPLPTPRLS